MEKVDELKRLLKQCRDALDSDELWAVFAFAQARGFVYSGPRVDLGEIDRALEG